MATTETPIAAVHAHASRSRLRWLVRQLHWKLIAARLVVAFLAVAATVAIFPTITIKGDFWEWCAVLAAVFGLLNAFLKPALQILTIRYLFLSYGLVLIVINLAVFWLLTVLVDRLDVENFWALLGGCVVIGVIATLLENLIGICPPIVDYQAPPHARREQA
jgi:putative membrane protein